MISMILISFYILLFVHAVFLTIVIANYFTAPRIGNKKVELSHEPFISILIPARNEEKNISVLLASLLNQSYVNYEIIVLDDNSEDRTNEIVRQYSDEYKNIKLVKGNALPVGWLGKNWACYQLAEQAAGKYYLFIDADVRLERHALANAFSGLLKYDCAMLSVFPAQQLKGFGEWLTVPLMNWLLLTFLPLKLVYSSSNPGLSAANGQFILIEKDAYNRIGSHKAVKSAAVEDMEIVRRIKSAGYKVNTAISKKSVRCKMYESFNEAVNGFSKNFYKGFGTSRSIFLGIVSLLFLFFFAPVILSIYYPQFLIIILLIVLERLLVSEISAQNIFINLVLHPVQMLVLFYIGINSLLKKELLWKGRRI